MNGCWSTGIPLNATEIVIPDNSCNEEEDGLDLREYTNLKRLRVGNNCFAKSESVDFSFSDSLESITIGMNSFMGGNSNPDNVLRIDYLYSLVELRIGRYSFSNYSLCDITYSGALEVLEIGNVNEDSFNFQYGSLMLMGLAMTAVSFVELNSLKSVVIGSKSFMYSKYALFMSGFESLLLSHRHD